MGQNKGAYISFHKKKIFYFHFGGYEWDFTEWTGCKTSSHKTFLEQSLCCRNVSCSSSFQTSHTCSVNLILHLGTLMLHKYTGWKIQIKQNGGWLWWTCWNSEVWMREHRGLVQYLGLSTHRYSESDRPRNWTWMFQKHKTIKSEPFVSRWSGWSVAELKWILAEMTKHAINLLLTRLVWTVNYCLDTESLLAFIVLYKVPHMSTSTDLIICYAQPWCQSVNFIWLTEQEHCKSQSLTEMEGPGSHRVWLRSVWL